MYGDTNTTLILAIVYIFIKKILKRNWENLYLEPHFAMTTPCRGYWLRELNFLDEILANQGFKDIIEISQFVDLAFSLREKHVTTCLYAHTPWHISDTKGPNQKW
jgi:hypothetical protein